MWPPLIAFVEPCRLANGDTLLVPGSLSLLARISTLSHGLPSCSARCKLVLHILLNPPGRPLALKPATLTPSVSDRAVAELRLQTASTADGKFVSLADTPAASTSADHGPYGDGQLLYDQLRKPQALRSNNSLLGTAPGRSIFGCDQHDHAW